MYGWIYDYAGKDSFHVNNELHRIIFREGRRMKSMTGDFREDLLWNCARSAMNECRGNIDMEYVEDAIIYNTD
jgi:hypothetical protein